MSFLIADGFTLDGLLPARAGLHGETKFTYRPALPDRVAGYLRDVAQASPDKALSADIKLLSEHIVGVEGMEWPSEVYVRAKLLRKAYHVDIQAMVGFVCAWTSTEWMEREKN